MTPLVGVITPTIVVIHELPQARELRVVVADLGGGGLVARTSDLHLHLRVRAEVVQPGGRLWIAALGGHHQPAPSVLCVDERVGPRLTAPAPRRAKHQAGHAEQTMPDQPVGVLVEEGVDVERRLEQRLSD